MRDFAKSTTLDDSRQNPKLLTLLSVRLVRFELVDDLLALRAIDVRVENLVQPRISLLLVQKVHELVHAHQLVFGLMSVLLESAQKRELEFVTVFGFLRAG